MLHLVSIRLLLTVFGLAAMSVYAICLRTGYVSNESWSELFFGVFKVATPIVLGAMALTVVLWRWSPLPLQRILFPYLGGEWDGEIEFQKDGEPVRHPASLTVVHTVTSMHFALSTAESTSKTLVVHAGKAAVLSDLVKLVYIYEVERREGFPGAGDRYRGCAFIDVQLSKPYTMVGSYMAGPGRSGALRMRRRKATSWWVLWR